MQRRQFLHTASLCSAAAFTGTSAAFAEKLDWPVGHHFWNWDHAWNDAEHLDIRLQLTRDTGYTGFEAKPEEIGVSPEDLKARCARYGVQCAAIGGGLERGFEYALKCGARVLRCGVPKENARDWVARADDHGIILVVHNHLGGKDAKGEVETREDLLRYLDDRPGMYACPDTGHLAVCGSDPVQTILDLGERCRYTHLKDYYKEAFGKRRESGGRMFCELGTGALDLTGVIDALKKIHYNGWIMIERDSRESDYADSARRMRHVLRRYGL